MADDGAPTSGARRFGRRRVTLWFWVVLGLAVAPVMVSAARLALADRPHWSAASHASTGQAPDPAASKFYVRVCTIYYMVFQWGEWFYKKKLKNFGIILRNQLQ